jgi:hypothetical protein
LVNNGDTTIAGTFGLKFNGSGVMQLYFNGSLYTRPTRVAPGDTVIYALTYDERTGAVEFWDSKNNSSLLVTNLPYLNLSASLVTMGANSLATHWFNGMIGEVKIFTGKLPASSFQSEREALATKWGATVASTNAYLADLVLSDGTLTPAFSSNILSYTASVSNEVTSLTVTPTAADDAATIAVRVNGGNYAPVTSGSMSDALNLNEGANTVDVRVTAQNLAFTSIYTTTVTRAAAGPTPESITTTVNNGNLILSWTQANWSLATGTNVTAITNIIAGATSPYTNALSSDPQRYFRLVFP